MVALNLRPNLPPSHTFSVQAIKPTRHTVFVIALHALAHENVPQSDSHSSRSRSLRASVPLPLQAARAITCPMPAPQYTLRPLLHCYSASRRLIAQWHPMALLSATHWTAKHPKVQVKGRGIPIPHSAVERWLERCPMGNFRMVAPFSGKRPCANCNRGWSVCTFATEWPFHSHYEKKRGKQLQPLKPLRRRKHRPVYLSYHLNPDRRQLTSTEKAKSNHTTTATSTAVYLSRRVPAGRNRLKTLLLVRSLHIDTEKSKQDHTSGLSPQSGFTISILDGKGANRIRRPPHPPRG